MLGPEPAGIVDVLAFMGTRTNLTQMRDRGRIDMKNRKSGRSRSPMETIPVKNPARLGRDVQAKIGQQLRAMYDDVVNQGIPDRFTELLNRLDHKDEKGR
jgi:hypothetical protein